ncbi:MAG: peptidylprolyl isomerase [Syntrophales bacterium]|jgi:peptidyl-prolyl cis-trans isomerase C|nr:peptidylprolyl isomerase [Syntrophales bacterium]
MTGLVVLFLVALYFPPLFAAEKQDNSFKPVAKVNGVAISQREVDEAVASLLPQASYHRNVTPEKIKELEKKALENLIQEELFYRGALKKGYKAGKDAVNKRLAEIVKKYPSRKAYREALKKYGLTEGDVRKKLDHIMLAELFLKEEVYKKSELKDTELRAYYQKNREKFQKPEAMRLSHILIRVPPEAPRDEKEKLKKKAEDLLQRLKKGEDFQKLAWDNSDDPSRVKGGDLGVVHRGRLEPDVENPAFSLKKGELSGVVTSIYGHHIFKAVEKFPPQQLKFEEVKEKLKKELEQKAVEKRLADLLMSLKENAKIEVYGD